jgi:hypothetical protein
MKDGVHMPFAVCAEHPMADSAHFVEMTLLKHQAPACIGVVGQGFDAKAFAQSRGEASSATESWLLRTNTGVLWHAGKSSDWEGKVKGGELKAGDVVGLLLDLGQRKLSVYVNGVWRGVMVAPGMKTYYGEVVAPLVGPLMWAVLVDSGDESSTSVRIVCKPPPPS